MAWGTISLLLLRGSFRVGIATDTRKVLSWYITPDSKREVRGMTMFDLCNEDDGDVDK